MPQLNLSLLHHRYSGWFSTKNDSTIMLYHWWLCHGWLRRVLAFTSNYDPRSLKSAACGCHRRETRYSKPKSLNRIYPLPQEAEAAAPPPFRSGFLLSSCSSNSRSASPSPSIPSPESSPSPSPLSKFSAPSYYAYATDMLLALENTHGTAPTEQPHRSKTFNNTDVKTENPTGKERSRTQFSRETRRRCVGSLRNRVGKCRGYNRSWSRNSAMRSVSISRSVFKVWMNNNNNTFRKR